METLDFVSGLHNNSLNLLSVYIRLNFANTGIKISIAFIKLKSMD